MGTTNNWLYIGLNNVNATCLASQFKSFYCFFPFPISKRFAWGFHHVSQLWRCLSQGIQGQCQQCFDLQRRAIPLETRTQVAYIRDGGKCTPKLSMRREEDTLKLDWNIIKDCSRMSRINVWITKWELGGGKVNWLLVTAIQMLHFCYTQ